MRTLKQIRHDHQTPLFGAGQYRQDSDRREKKEACRLRPTPEDCCGRPMIPCWFRNKFKGFVCHTLQPMHWLSVNQLGRMGYFKSGKRKDGLKLTKLILED
jgi:hypothetical protein